jgi:hypothetical protein
MVIIYTCKVIYSRNCVKPHVSPGFGYLFLRFFRAAVNMYWNKLTMVAYRFISDALYDGRTYVKRNKTNILSYYRRTCFGPD